RTEKALASIFTYHAQDRGASLGAMRVGARARVHARSVQGRHAHRITQLNLSGQIFGRCFIAMALDWPGLPVRDKSHLSLRRCVAQENLGGRYTRLGWSWVDEACDPSRPHR